MKTKESASVENARAELKKYIKPAQTIIIVIKSVSRCGTNRRMRVYNKDMYEMTYLVRDLLGGSVNGKGFLINGCGMDMTFALADRITYGMYGNKKPKSLKGNGGGSVRCLNWKVL